MTTEVFRANVQYDDFKGTVAADRSEISDADAWLFERGLKNQNEFLVGITLYTGSNHLAKDCIASIKFLLATAGDHDTVTAAINENGGPLPVRSVTQDMPIKDFLSLFKRFSVYISNDGMLNGKEYTHEN